MHTLLRRCLFGLFVLVSGAGAATPVLQRPDSVGLQLGESLDYRLVAIGASTFAAQGLPPGVTINAATGALTGKPTELGTYRVTVTATNAEGSANGTLTIAVVAPDAAPLIYGPLLVDAFHEPHAGGDRFSCTLQATGAPTGYELTSVLPAGWFFNQGTLVGSSTEPGLYSVEVSAANANGIGSAAVTVRVHPSCRRIEQTTGALRAGDAFTVTLQFNRAVTFTGEAPYLEFHTYPDGTTRRIPYVSGNGSATFVFRYIVAANDAAGDILLYRAIQPAANSAVSGLIDANGVTLGASLPFEGPYTPVARIEAAVTTPPVATSTPATSTPTSTPTTTVEPTPSTTVDPTPTGNGSSGLPGAPATSEPVASTPTPTSSATPATTPTPVDATPTLTTPVTDPAPAAAATRLINVSARGQVADGDSAGAFIAGFVVAGTSPKKMLVRAVGPTLASYGVQSALGNPQLRLFDAAGRVVAQNEDWSGSETSGTASRVGAFELATGSRDAALTVTLNPGSYSMQVVPNGGNGVALAEVYDADGAASGSALVNLSMRGQASGGEGVLAAGFVVSGSSPKRVLIRGVGPELAKYGVGGTLANPKVTVYQGATVVAENDDWGTQVGGVTAADVAAAAETLGAFRLPSGSRDAAVVVTLPPGIYTAVAGPADGSARGAALVEVYEF